MWDCCRGRLAVPTATASIRRNWCKGCSSSCARATLAMQWMRYGHCCRSPIPVHKPARRLWRVPNRSEEHTSELLSLLRISYAFFFLFYIISSFFFFFFFLFFFFFFFFFF